VWKAAARDALSPFHRIPSSHEEAATNTLTLEAIRHELNGWEKMSFEPLRRVVRFGDAKYDAELQALSEKEDAM
jgi:hypothetical protein